VSGNYKPRAKSEEEKAHDLKMVLEKIDNCAEACSGLVEELEVCGDAWLSTISKARGKISHLEYANIVMKQKKVGELHDLDKGITGEYYYNDI
jgi:hypothetical protein|tara:strand:- start:442 stop:720 length:279 start_codon:yes stop_codon:yes gene_type:complete